MLAAQGDDVGGALGGPVHACLLGAVDHDGFDSAFDGARADEHAQVAEVLVAHPVRVVFEVAELLVQLADLDAGQRVLPCSGDDRLDVAGVEAGAAVLQPLCRVGVMKAR
jgi:hypothetical protein